MERDELAGWLRLALTYEANGAAARRLLAAFGLPANVFRQDTSALAQVVDRGAAEALVQEPADFAAKLDATWAWWAQDREHRQVWTLADAASPQPLPPSEDPPLSRSRRGRWKPPRRRAWASLGGRTPPPRGCRMRAASPAP